MSAGLSLMRKLLNDEGLRCGVEVRIRVESKARRLSLEYCEDGSIL